MNSIHCLCPQATRYKLLVTVIFLAQVTDDTTMKQCETMKAHINEQKQDVMFSTLHPVCARTESTLHVSFIKYKTGTNLAGRDHHS